MSWILWDPDEWETVVKTETHGGVMGVSQRRRSPEEIAAIKAEKRRKHEEAVLAEADAIRANRATT